MEDETLKNWSQIFKIIIFQHSYWAMRDPSFKP